jgi:hypothetical protein
LWVDDLCIDQSNNEEKSWQVAWMGMVYAMADHTIIYLGSLTEYSIDFLEALIAEEAVKEEVDKSCSLCSDIRDAGIEDLLGRPWFTRIWVFQELVFSRDPLGPMWEASCKVGLYLQHC